MNCCATLHTFRLSILALIADFLRGSPAPQAMIVAATHAVTLITHTSVRAMRTLLAAPAIDFRAPALDFRVLFCQDFPCSL